MPQITLEYTSNISQHLDFQALFSDLHRILSETGGVRINNCKSRAVSREVFLIGSGETGGAFVHVDVLLVEGRSPRWIERIGGLMLESLERAFEESKRTMQLQITIHFRDLKRERYFKYPEGTLTPIEQLEATVKC